MKLRRPRRRWLVPAALAPLVFLLGGPSADADTTAPPPWPGLPTTTWPSDTQSILGSLGSEGNGLTEAARARQWIKIPAQAVAAVAATKATQFPADDPSGRKRQADLIVHVFLSSPAGATEGYGIGLPVTVRSVAFGAVPVEVTMRLEQLRDADDLPVPLTLRDITIEFREGGVINVHGNRVALQLHAELTGQVRVRLTGLSVDGLDLGLQDCVSPPIDLHLRSKPFWKEDPLHDPNLHDPANVDYRGALPAFPYDSKEAVDWMASLGQYVTSSGGVTSGEVDIPAFSGCRTRSGEDVSPLVTSTVSGPGNSVTVGTAAFNKGRGCGTPLPPPLQTMVGRGPFQGDPSDCDSDFAPPTLDYPARLE